VTVVTESQEADHAYHEERLSRLRVQRDILPEDSDQMPSLAAQIAAVGNLVRSYRLLKSLEGMKVELLFAKGPTVSARIR
jgi:hypothetical protein